MKSIIKKLEIVYINLLILLFLMCVHNNKLMNQKKIEMYLTPYRIYF